MYKKWLVILLVGLSGCFEAEEVEVAIPDPYSGLLKKYAIESITIADLDGQDGLRIKDKLISKLSHMAPKLKIYAPQPRYVKSEKLLYGHIFVNDYLNHFTYTQLSDKHGRPFAHYTAIAELTVEGSINLIVASTSQQLGVLPISVSNQWDLGAVDVDGDVYPDNDYMASRFPPVDIVSLENQTYETAACQVVCQLLPQYKKVRLYRTNLHHDSVQAIKAVRTGDYVKAQKIYTNLLSTMNHYYKYSAAAKKAEAYLRYNLAVVLALSQAFDPAFAQLDMAYKLYPDQKFAAHKQFLSDHTFSQYNQQCTDACVQKDHSI